MIEFRVLQHALALERHQNFARAAAALNLSQPSLSRSIAGLEQLLGVPLFDRGPKQVVPTVFGRILLERGAELLRGEGELRREIQLLAGLELGTLVIGAAPYPTEISIGSAVARLSSAHPRLKIRVVTGDPDEICRKVLGGEFDVGVASAYAAEGMPRLQLESLSPHAIHLACRAGHPLAALPRPSLATILAFPLVSTLFSSDVAAVVGAFQGAGSIDPESRKFAPAIHVNTLTLARQIALGCDALFPCTDAMIAAELASGSLVKLPFQHPLMKVNQSLITLRDRTLSPATQAFLGVMRDLDLELATGHS